VSKTSSFKLHGSIPKLYHHLESSDKDLDENQEIYAHIVIRSKSGYYPDIRTVGLGNFFSLDEYTELYGADIEDIEMVRNWCQNQNLDCEEYSLGGRLIILSGSLENFGRAFQVTFKYYKYQGRSIISHASHLTIPIEFKEVIKHIGGLSEIIPRLRIIKMQMKLPSESIEPPDPKINAAHYAQYYKFPEKYNNKKLDGKDMNFAIIALGGEWKTIKGDVEQYAKNLKLPVPKTNVLEQKNYQPVSSQSPNPDQELDFNNAEVAVDLEVSISIVPEANFQIFFAKNSLVGLEWALTVAAFGTNLNPRKNKDVPTVMSLSWNFPEEGIDSGVNEHFVETYMNLNEYFIKPAVMLGITFVTCSGDWGSSNQSSPARFSVSCPASSPYTLAVGGSFLDYSKGPDPVEQVWNQSVSIMKLPPMEVASGGGFSRFFGAPRYQSSHIKKYFENCYGKLTGVDQLIVAYGMPDVVAVANSSKKGYYVVIFNGKPMMIPGGTSSSTPLWGGLIVKIAQALGTSLGVINRILYEKASKKKNCLNPISLTARKTNCLPKHNQTLNGLWKAFHGWDPCGGLGSPNGEELLKLFVNDCFGKNRIKSKPIRINP